MKVLHIINSADTGGAQTLIEGLSARRSSEDVAVLLVLMSPSTLSPRLEDAFTSVEYLGLSRRSPGLLGARRRAQAVVDRVRPDVIHSHLFQSDLCSLTLRSRGAARVTTVHATGVSRADPVLTRVLVRFVGRLSGRFGAIVASDASCLPFMQAAGYRSTPVVIPNGSPIPDRPPPYASGSTSLLSLARWHPMKGHDVLLSAFGEMRRRHPGWTLVCAGADMTPDNEALVSLVHRAGLQIGRDVELRGPLQDGTDLIGLSAALVISSIYGETFPMVGSEATGRGVPVITTDIGGASRFAVDPRFVVPPGSVDHLVTALERFATLSAGDRCAMSNASRELATREFDIASSVTRYAEVYDQVLGAGRR